MSALAGSRLGTLSVSMILSGRCAHLQSGCFTILSCRIHDTGYCGLSRIANHQGMSEGHAQIQIPPNYALDIEPMTHFLGINECRQTIATGNPRFGTVALSRAHMARSHLSHAIGMCSQCASLPCLHSTNTFHCIDSHEITLLHRPLVCSTSSKRMRTFALGFPSLLFGEAIFLNIVAKQKSR